MSNVMGHFATKIRPLAISLSCVLAVACQQQGTMVDKSPFTTDVVRLGDTVVAQIDGTEIYLSDVQNAAHSKGSLAPGAVLTPKDPVFQSTLDELIDQRLLAMEALRQSLDQNDEARRRIAASRERILSNIVVENLLQEKVTEEAVKRVYEEQLEMQSKREQVRARHILVDTEEEANTIIDLMKAGGDFAALAKQLSKDRSTRDLGGDLGYFSKDALAGGIAELAFTLKVNEVSSPFKSSKGWHVLIQEDRRQAPQPKFEDIQAEIETFMTYQEIEAMLKALRAASTIELVTGVNTQSPKDTGLK